MFIRAGKLYKLAKIGLVRAACPNELQSSNDNIARSRAIVVDKNVQKLGFVRDTGYWPSTVITAGAALRQSLLDNGQVFAYAFVAEDAVLKCDDAIGCSELMSKLYSAISSKFYPSGQISASQTMPNILEVYPFENYFIYAMRSDKFRQQYYVDPMARLVRLNGGSVKVQEMYINASMYPMPTVSGPLSNLRSGDSKQFMPRSETGAAYAVAPPMGNAQSSTTGGKTSDLVTMLIRRHDDVNKAVDVYLQAIKNGAHTPLRIAFAPVPLSSAGKILSALAARGVDPYDFARWTASCIECERTANYKGEKIPVSKVGYVDKQGNAHLPFNTPGRARNALARINQTKGVPGGSKVGVLNKVRRAATTKGVDVSDKTSKQKRWASK